MHLSTLLHQVGAGGQASPQSPTHWPRASCPRAPNHMDPGCLLVHIIIPALSPQTLANSALPLPPADTSVVWAPRPPLNATKVTRAMVAASCYTWLHEELFANRSSFIWGTFRHSWGSTQGSPVGMTAASLLLISFQGSLTDSYGASG